MVAPKHDEAPWQSTLLVIVDIDDEHASFPSHTKISATLVPNLHAFSPKQWMIFAERDGRLVHDSDPVQYRSLIARNLDVDPHELPPEHETEYLWEIYGRWKCNQRNICKMCMYIPYPFFLLLITEPPVHEE